jgi:L-threonylcarbamoyladenylate synthase
MSTPVLDVRSDASLPALLRAAEVLRQGGLVAFPTETVYGLGANALDSAAVERIFQAKARPATNPIIVHVAEPADVRAVAATWPEEAERLVERFWPGPLTLVLPRSPAVPDIVTAGAPTVAVRLPAHAVARQLIALAGVPIAAPSANRSSQLSPTLAEHVRRDLDGRIDLILDGGPTPGGIESTVLDLTTRPARLLRPGLVSPDAIEAVIGPIVHSQAPEPTAALPSPGMLPRHYAPRTRLECIEGNARERVEELVKAGFRVAWVTHEVVPTDLVPAGVRVGRLPADPAGYAAGLYAVLHTLDDGQADRIVVSLPPEGDDWLGIRDRLLRAATPA